MQSRRPRSRARSHLCVCPTDYRAPIKMLTPNIWFMPLYFVIQRSAVEVVPEKCAVSKQGGEERGSQGCSRQVCGTRFNSMLFYVLKQQRIKPFPFTSRLAPPLPILETHLTHFYSFAFDSGCDLVLGVYNFCVWEVGVGSIFINLLF